MRLAKAHTWMDDPRSKWEAGTRRWLTLESESPVRVIGRNASWDSIAAELLKVVAQRDRALEALADLRGVSINSILEEWRNE